jgi:hypothetical protein
MQLYSVRVMAKECNNDTVQRWVLEVPGMNRVVPQPLRACVCVRSRKFLHEVSDQMSSSWTPAVHKGLPLAGSERLKCMAEFLDMNRAGSMCDYVNLITAFSRQAL